MSFTNLRGGLSGHRTNKRHSLVRFGGLSNSYFASYNYTTLFINENSFYLAGGSEVSEHE